MFIRSISYLFANFFNCIQSRFFSNSANSFPAISSNNFRFSITSVGCLTAGAADCEARISSFLFRSLLLYSSSNDPNKSDIFRLSSLSVLSFTLFICSGLLSES